MSLKHNYDKNLMKFKLSGYFFSVSYSFIQFHLSINSFIYCLPSRMMEQINDHRKDDFSLNFSQLKKIYATSTNFRMTSKK